MRQYRLKKKAKEQVSTNEVAAKKVTIAELSAALGDDPKRKRVTMPDDSDTDSEDSMDKPAKRTRVKLTKRG